MEPVLAVLLAAVVLLSIGLFLLFVPSMAFISVVLIGAGLALMFGLGVYAGRSLTLKDISRQIE